METTSDTDSTETQSGSDGGGGTVKQDDTKREVVSTAHVAMKGLRGDRVSQDSGVGSTEGERVCCSEGEGSTEEGERVGSTEGEDEEDMVDGFPRENRASCILRHNSPDLLELMCQDLEGLAVQLHSHERRLINKVTRNAVIENGLDKTQKALRILQQVEVRVGREPEVLVLFVEVLQCCLQCDTVTEFAQRILVQYNSPPQNKDDPETLEEQHHNITHSQPNQHNTTHTQPAPQSLVPGDKDQPLYSSVPNDFLDSPVFGNGTHTLQRQFSRDAHTLPTNDSHTLPTSYATSDAHTLPTSDSHTLPTSDSHTLPTSDTHTLPTSDSHTLPTSDSHTLPTSDTHTLPISDSHTLQRQFSPGDEDLHMTTYSLTRELLSISRRQERRIKNVRRELKITQEQAGEFKDQVEDSEARIEELKFTVDHLQQLLENSQLQLEKSGRKNRLLNEELVKYKRELRKEKEATPKQCGSNCEHYTMYLESQERCREKEKALTRLREEGDKYKSEIEILNEQVDILVNR